eukprot:2347387-Pleurochrysis_carterae.AAC.1
MRRVRLRIDNTNEVNGRLGTIALEDTSTSAAVASERLVALTEALREEFEAEMHFAQCFDACLLSGDEIEQPPAAASTVHATRAAAVAANSRKSVPLACRDASVGRGSAVSATASQLAPGGGYDAALEAFAREMHADISAVRANFNTVEAHGLRAVKVRLAPNRDKRAPANGGKVETSAPFLFGPGRERAGEHGGKVGARRAENGNGKRGADTRKETLVNTRPSFEIRETSELWTAKSSSEVLCAKVHGSKLETRGALNAKL